MEWLVDFALTEVEQREVSAQTAVKAVRRAARVMYETDKFAKRGEFGELLLHVIQREHFGTVPAIRKIFFKDSTNNTVKGFDAVHVSADGTDDEDADLELWLGEAKFYKDLGQAVRDVVTELHDHSRTDYLRSEFTVIVNKIERDSPYWDRLTRLLDPSTSLDQVFERVRVPVLLTYDSEATASATEHSREYIDGIRTELLEAHAAFVGRGAPQELVVHLVVVPLSTKEALVELLHAKLRGLQGDG
jgi:hypothetical protein